MDPLEHKILKIIQINGPLEAEDVLSLLLQSLSLAEREEMEHPITLDQVRKILTEAASYNLVTRDTAGFKIAEIMWNGDLTREISYLIELFENSINSSWENKSTDSITLITLIAIFDYNSKPDLSFLSSRMRLSLPPHIRIRIRRRTLY